MTMPNPQTNHCENNKKNEPRQLGGSIFFSSIDGQNARQS